MARNFILDPAHWRFRAEETRTIAGRMTHEDARTIMRRIANDFVDQGRGAIGSKT
jgi:hypothetical protein